MAKRLSTLRVLLLGGTTEASALARLLAVDGRFRATLSLAGVTRAPRPQPIPWRIGGFGGVEGLRRSLAEAGVEALVDATHPFAAQMTRHAIAAAGTIPLLRVERPAWTPCPGDHWLPVPDMPAAARALGPTPRRVLLTIGQKELAPFRDMPSHHYIIRSVDPPEAALVPPGTEIITATGPFSLEEERELLARYDIQAIVTKNSGGSATAAKLVAARERGIPVVVVQRPTAPEVETVADAEAAMAWLRALWERGQGSAASLGPPLG
jgi:precorrin-6A/cobalt-precorrin-6A reductase